MKIKKILLGLRRKSRHMLGIDIRKNFIGLVELSFDPTGYQIETCANIAIGDQDEPNQRMATAITSILKPGSAKTTNVATALPHSAVIFKEIKVDPGLSRKEIEEFLHFKLAEHLGEEEISDTICFDYQVIATKADTPTILRLVAIRREQVEKRIELLRTLNLRPKIVDVDVYAIERAVRLQLPNIIGLVAIINIDCSAILSVVLDSKGIIYSHEDFVASEFLGSIDQVVVQLDLQLQMISQATSQSPHQIILSGEGATLVGLAESVNSRLNIPTIIANPFLGMKLSQAVAQEVVNRLAPLMLIGCGLALRVADDYRD